jgi:hypothetical protein
MIGEDGQTQAKDDPKGKITPDRNRPGSIFVWWLLVNIAAWIFATYMQTLQGDPMRYYFVHLSGFFQVMTVMLVISLVIAICQWFVLRVIISNSGWWIPATMIGTIAGVLLAKLLGEDWFGYFFHGSRHLTGVQGGYIELLHLTILPVAILQWLILRRSVSNAWIWIPAKAIGLLLGPLIGTVLFCIMPVLSGVISGSITGVFLAWYLPKHRIQDTT